MMEKAKNKARDEERFIQLKEMNTRPAEKKEDAGREGGDTGRR